MLTRRDLLRTGAAASSCVLLAPWSKHMGCGCAKHSETNKDNAYSLSTPHVNSKRGDIHTRANVLLNQLSIGMDYYGQPQSYAPIASATYAYISLADLIQGGKSVDTALTRYRSNQADLSQQMDALSLSRSQAMAQLDRIQKDYNEIPQQQKLIADQITTLSSDQITARAEAIDAATKLTNTLGGCPIQTVFAAASMIITFATGVPPVVTSLIGAAAAAANGTPFGPQDNSNPGASSLFGSAFDTKIKDLQIVSSDLGKLSDLYHRSQNLHPQTPENVDAVKFMVQDGDFAALRKSAEKEVKGIPDSSPEKQAYLDAVDRYLTITQTRNQLVLAYDGLSYRLASAKTLEASTNNALDHVQGVINSVSADASQIGKALKFTQEVQGELLRDAQFRLIRYAQAVSYMTLDTYNPPKEIDDFEVMDGQAALLQTNYRDAAQAMANNPPGNVDTRTTPLKIYLSAKQVASLSKGGPMSFQVSSKDPQFRNHGFFAGLYIDSVEIEFFVHELFGPKPIPPFPFSLQHSGYHKFFTRDGIVREFVSPLRSISSGNSTVVEGFTNSSNPNHNDSDYAGVSPFTTWTVFVENPPKELQKVEHLRIGFVGRGYGLSQDAISKLRNLREIS